MMYHANPEQFITSSAEYGPIGEAMVKLSNLEFSHDQFMLALVRNSPEVAKKLSKSFPRQFKDKIDFLVNAIVEVPKLRTVPVLNDGTLNLQWLQYQLDELYSLRAALAHGSIFYSETHQRGKLWRLDRIVSPEKGKWGEMSVTIGSTFLADACTTAHVLKYYLVRLTGAINGSYSWEETYKEDLEIARNRAFIRDLMKEGLIQPDESSLRIIGNEDE